MRVGKSASRVAALKLDSVAKAAAMAIRDSGDPGDAIPRFLIRLSDYLQSALPATRSDLHHPWVARGTVKKTGRP
jgi:hypothetical protein